ncbi:WD40-repeat-containing domain protein [Ochromonadaceae sp. CCMP2298]|nr:WD40-repeat-containing domain protein [Ochromonadaceae sp. CCMP2298]|mmetsp:Transcript_21239/g.47168  ORF Transcript_21239/g.47168 Transcript_21239/m.47168 type:complete len:437 (-) Transcript_21239:109-1419(-)|eukprot:CAMPEP_0173194766 /NCGR_PEP_ID=MMETSP1141-20130122/14686_1 /TAXON_ID=483371 /ORGANISM="non described non described, Strain CCMP2298" /LENGTH=436 /DNA_ID=CAMNT_0014119229 /DNA_START=113 /DNA_END=1423 /DNA_ORIENTATION=+
MEENEAAQDRVLQEEYKVWKKNTPYMYDLVMTHSLEWPSLTVQWLPDVSQQGDVNIHKLILGTHTSDGEPNYLMIGEIKLPLPTVDVDAKNFEDEKGEMGGYGGTLGKVEIKVKIRHEGEVHRARAMPQNRFLIATKAPNHTVWVFDYSKHGSAPRDNIVRPEHKLHGHSADGYGLCWNPLTEGRLLSGSDDCNVCMWDLREAAVDVQPLQTRKGHTNVVEDVDWSHHHAHLFASVGDDKQLLLWDARQQGDPVKTVMDAHSDDINCVSFNPLNEFLLATGSTDTTVALWDVRQMTQKLHVFEGHRGGVYQLDWAPFNETILATCSSDRRVNVWDVSRIGAEQSPEEAEEGPPELLFVHGGHSAKVSDFHWSKNEQWCAASVSEDNIMQIWQMSASHYTEKKEVVVEDEDLEGEEEEEPAVEMKVDTPSPSKRRRQ